MTSGAIGIPAGSFYQGPEFEPYLLAGGSPAALLVHGFPGTPAELRPLADELHRAGWTARGMLLPGFGPGIHTLPRQTRADWVTAVASELAALKREHAPVLLIGFSFGGPVSILAAEQTPPTGLVLLAPFVWQDPAPLRVLGPLAPLALPRTIRPFAGTNLADPANRDRVAALLGMGQLDAAGAEALHRLSVPGSVLRQVRATAWPRRHDLSAMPVPPLIIAGRDDAISHPDAGRRLATRLGAGSTLYEVPGAHELISPAHQAWDEVLALTLGYGRTLLRVG